MVNVITRLSSGHGQCLLRYSVYPSLYSHLPARKGVSGLHFWLTPSRSKHITILLDPTVIRSHLESPNSSIYLSSVSRLDGRSAKGRGNSIDFDLCTPYATGELDAVHVKPEEVPSFRMRMRTGGKLRLMLQVVFMCDGDKSGVGCGDEKQEAH